MSFISIASRIFRLKIPWWVSALVMLAALWGVGSYLLSRRAFYESHYPFCMTGAFERDVNLRRGNFAIRAIFIAWLDPFPADRVQEIAAVGSLPMIPWEPYLKDNRDRSILPDIADGKYDEMVQTFAVAAKAYGAPLLLRWGHEPNGNWYSWSGVRNSPELYIAAYRRMHGIFRVVGADNIKFVFSVNHEDVPAHPNNRFELFYPGSEVVDLVGIDAYNWGDMKPWGWKEPKKLLYAPYRRAVRAFPGKPLMLSEIGCCSSGGDKLRWVRDFFVALPSDFPAVKAFVWFDTRKECDWSLSNDAGVNAVYEEFARKRYFSHLAADFLAIFGETHDQNGPTAKN